MRVHAASERHKLRRFLRRMLAVSGSGFGRTSEVLVGHRPVEGIGDRSV